MQVELKFRRTETAEGMIINRKFNTKKQAREFVKTHHKDIIQAAIWKFDGYAWYINETLK